MTPPTRISTLTRNNSINHNHQRNSVELDIQYLTVGNYKKPKPRKKRQKSSASLSEEPRPRLDWKRNQVTYDPDAEYFNHNDSHQRNADRNTDRNASLDENKAKYENENDNESSDLWSNILIISILLTIATIIAIPTLVCVIYHKSHKLQYNFECLCHNGYADVTLKCLEGQVRCLSCYEGAILKDGDCYFG